MLESSTVAVEPLSLSCLLMAFATSSRVAEAPSVPPSSSVAEFLSSCTWTDVLPSLTTREALPVEKSVATASSALAVTVAEVGVVVDLP